MDIRNLAIAILAAAALNGCATGYSYRGGAGDYYYGQPSVDYYNYDGYGYGGYGGYGRYGGYGYSGFGYGYPYLYPYAYYGGHYPYYPGHRYPYYRHRHRNPHPQQPPGQPPEQPPVVRPVDRGDYLDDRGRPRDASERRMRHVRAPVDVRAPVRRYEGGTRAVTPGSTPPLQAPPRIEQASPPPRFEPRPPRAEPSAARTESRVRGGNPAASSRERDRGRVQDP